MHSLEQMLHSQHDDWTVLSCDQNTEITDARLWEELISERFSSVNCEVVSGRRLSASLAYRKLKNIEVTFGKGSPHRVYHPLECLKSERSAVSFNLLVSGHTRVEQCNNSFSLKAHDCCFIDLDSEYVMEHSEDYELITYKIPKCILNGELSPMVDLINFGSSTNEFFKSTASKFIQSITNNLTYCDQKSAPVDTDVIHSLKLALSLYVDSLDLQVSPSGSRSKHLIAKVKYLVDRNLSNQDLNRDFVSRQVGMSIRRLNELFMEEQQSLSRYILERRLLYASQLLRSKKHSDLSITDIAMKCGLNDSSHFSRAFSNKFSITPREFRQQMRSL